MADIPEKILQIKDETTKYDWIDQKIKDLAKELLKNYVLAEYENSAVGNTKKDPELTNCVKYIPTQSNDEHFSVDLYKHDKSARTRRRSIVV